jgi:hypothetical protein
VCEESFGAAEASASDEKDSGDVGVEEEWEFEVTRVLKYYPRRVVQVHCAVEVVVENQVSGR